MVLNSTCHTSRYPTFNRQLDSIKTDLNKTNLELSSAKQEILQKNNRLDQLSSKIEDLETTFEGYKLDPIPIFNRLDSLEDQSRRNNLRIDGIPENTKENWENTSLHVERLAEKLVLNGILSWTGHIVLAISLKPTAREQ